MLVIGSAAITATSTAYSPTFYPLILLLLPLIIRMLFENTLIYNLLSLGLTVICIMLFFLHRNSHDFYANALKQRFINETLAAQLALQKDIAEQANISKSKFLAMASHDLRQPLQSLNLFLGELRSQKTTTKENQVLLDNMHKSINGMNDLFDGLMDVSRFEEGVVSAHFKYFKIDELLESLQLEYSARAQAKDLSLHCVPCTVRVNSDPLLLRRIIRNLLENSLRYTHKGRIVLGCRRKPGFICLQVLDTGLGIAEKNIQHIFNEFQQLNNPAADKNKGIGLGLTVVRQLAGVLDHKLEVESVVNNGSVFSLYIPLADDFNAQINAGLVADNLENAGVVLMGQRAENLSTQKLLKTWGCDVICVTDFDNGLKTIASSANSVDLIIINGALVDAVKLSDIVSGLAAYSALDVPILLLVENLEKLKINMNENINILQQPINPVQLATQLRFLLAEKNANNLITV